MSLYGGLERSKIGLLSCRGMETSIGATLCDGILRGKGDLLENKM